ncbi:TetR/AcrR family transcriptional regulator [Anaerocolumna aminovalerica]|uniref:TetR/AcrR family transcriptional regulator n=1 Tax=Anaerocolumna aminovalerica TaxID=1527 RepID=UPI0015967A0F|nr:TetR/AcrR family transcriptional regulator [Anaerocolumna aminovalerica]
MKRKAKNQQSRQKIIDSALQEFSEKYYAEASLNSICSMGNISKGIIYHYFNDKDDLYLTCVRECFDSLTAYLSENFIVDNTNVKVCLQKYFTVRNVFFNENPIYLKLFFNTVINPPEHLIKAIKEIRAEFDGLNISILTKLLESVKLNSGIAISEAVEHFRMYQDYFNLRYQLEHKNNLSLEEHEEHCHRWLNIFLYGIINQEEETIYE